MCSDWISYIARPLAGFARLVEHTLITFARVDQFRPVGSVEYPISTRDRVPQTITCDPRRTGYVDWKHSSCLRNRLGIVRGIELSPEEQAVSLEKIHYITRHPSPPFCTNPLWSGDANYHERSGFGDV
jgi:hypothetical protein